MDNIVRILVMVAAGGLVLALLGWGLIWWFEESRRLKRLVKRTLGGDCDAAIVARGRNAAAGFRVDTDQFVVMAKGGAEARLYRLDQVQGAELLVDDAVTARVYRNESRRALEKLDSAPQEIALRLVFDDPRAPDFDLLLWQIEDLESRHALTPKAVLQEARSWLSRTESLLRRGGTGRVAIPTPVAAVAEAPPWEDEEDAG
jgi:hypothetical protein